MLFYTHLLFAGFLASSLGEFIPAGQAATFIITALFAALLPDIDNRKSLIGKFFPLVGIAATHRGFFHTPLAALLFWLAARSFGGQVIGSAFLTGYLSHIALDSLSRKGIALFFPLSMRRLRGPIMVGSAAETALAIITAAALGLSLL